ncbi:unnamed protein product [Rotaria sordida]|uniref:NmrA-like family domain-containing protein 1 n=1 Tax=Rotaria sordida TaxID=392033 RepID=A0A814HX19_9BILA|nr:unnamed protein product [Rotaria sordida]CAF1175967.1 unnamed protein product [Rotaria sordida]
MASSSGTKIIAIIGGTGAMGRPIIAALSQTNSYKLRVLTRDTQSEQAKTISKTYPNVELIEGNYADDQCIRKLFTSIYGVFCNTDIWSCGGYQNEIDLGKMIFNIAKEMNVQHFIYSSLDHTQKLLANHGGYRCHHYDAKAIVAEYIESNDPKRQIPWTIITTAPYFENFQSVFLPKKDPADSDQLIFTFPMADKPIVLVALDDIAWFVKYSFENPNKSIGKNYYIAGDNITMDELVRTFSEITGIRAKYDDMPLEKYVETMREKKHIDFDRKENFIGFFQQFLQEKVNRNFNALKTIHPDLLNWRQWLVKTGWKGERGTINTSSDTEFDGDSEFLIKIRKARSFRGEKPILP